ncbi:MAG: LTA synthase family protein [Bacteroidales bacterium]
MLQRFYFLVKHTLFFITIFIFSKISFLIYHGKDLGFSDFWGVVFHGFSMDLTVVGYFTVLPCLFLIISLYCQNKVFYNFWRIYNVFVIALTSMIVLGDMELYKHWGFRIDSSVMLYLQSPQDAFASVPLWQFFVGLFFWLSLTYLLYKLYERLVFSEYRKLLHLNNQLWMTLVFMLITAFLFLPIRGGLSASTMNVGRAFYSDNMFLNHAAVNPCFSLFSSIFDQNQDFKYEYFQENEFQIQLNQIKQRSFQIDSALIKKERPNIVFVILESFASSVIGSLDSIYPSTPQLDRIVKDGLLFTNFYANSYRTDRGLTSILSAMPAMPNASWMKYPAKLASLPAWPKVFKNSGYDLEMLYGGDIDFTNMRMYFNSMGFDKIISQENIDKKLRTANWGVHDQYTFEMLADQIKKQTREPYLKLFLTLSSHPPYDVPYNKKQDQVLNSIAYTDSCLGIFIDKIKETPQWNNLLVCFVADHGMLYPSNMQQYDIQRFRIPFFVTGGALNKIGVDNRLASQMDIAQTLIALLGNFDDSHFPLSNNLFDSGVNSEGLFIYKNGIGVVRDSAQYIYDFDMNKAVVSQGQNDSLKMRGEVILQYLDRTLKAK